jgi:hypothetical protein
MANTDRAFGMRPVKHLDGSPWNGQVSTYYVPASDGTAIYVGDPVKSGGTSGAAGTVVYGMSVEGMATVAVAAAGDALRGVVVGFSPLQSNLETLHRAASTARLAYVVDSPDVVFEIQSDDGGAASAIADTGENADILYTAGSAVTGRSAVELDSSSHITATAQLRILGAVQRTDNEAGANFVKLHVVINEHELKSTTGL